MAFDKLPDSWISGLTEDGTDMTIPLASIAELTAAEADTVTGDIRKVWFALCKHMQDTWLATASADRPSKMTFSKSVSESPTTGKQTQAFTVQFVTDITGIEVADE